MTLRYPSQIKASEQFIYIVGRIVDMLEFYDSHAMRQNTHIINLIGVIGQFRLSGRILRLDSNFNSINLVEYQVVRSYNWQMNLNVLQLDNINCPTNYNYVDNKRIQKKNCTPLKSCLVWDISSILYLNNNFEIEFL